MATGRQAEVTGEWILGLINPSMVAVRYPQHMRKHLEPGERRGA